MKVDTLALTLEQAWLHKHLAVENFFDLTASLYDETGCPYIYSSCGELINALMSNQAQFHLEPFRFETDLGYTGVWNDIDLEWYWKHDDH